MFGAFYLELFQNPTVRTKETQKKVNEVKACHWSITCNDYYIRKNGWKD